MYDSSHHWTTDRPAGRCRTIDRTCRYDARTGTMQVRSEASYPQVRCFKGMLPSLARPPNYLTLVNPLNPQENHHCSRDLE